MAGLNKYQAYPEYRDSGVAWIDAIPFHWEVLPTFSLCEASTKKNIDGAENNVLSLSYGNIIPRDIETNFGLLPESFNTYQIVENGDIILRLTDLQNDKNSLRVGLAKQKGIITSAYLKLSSQGSMLSEYLYRLLHSYDTTKVFYGMGGGLRQSMKFEDFRRLPLLLPSKNEQGKIIDFLDHETAKIDNLIEKQQQLIELLKEKRQAVISHAVTKGLNPDVPMKDSGVDWLGKIPSHWEMKKLAYLGSARNGLTYSPESITDNESGILVLRSSNIQHSCLSFDDNVYVKTIIPEQFLVKENDLLICSRNGSRNLIGKNALINKEAEGMAFGAFMAIFRSNINKYLFWVLNSTLFDYQSGSFLTSTINQLTIGNLNSMEVPVPPSKEQKEIESHLSKKNYDFIELISNVHSHISLLLERRTALISAAVTGKIDLRNWAAPIPEAETPTEASA